MKRPEQFINAFESENNEHDQELEKYSSRVLLHFTRHGEKASDPGKKNEEQRLTPKGRLEGLAKGRQRGQGEKTSVAFGGLERSQEIAGFEMAGAHLAEEITGEETLEELRVKLDQDLKFGTRLGVDRRLGFEYHDETYEKIKDQAYAQNRGLEFFVKESDRLASELKDNKSTTYSRSAASVAELLGKYIAIASRFDEIVSDEKNRQQYGSVLERFMGSHNAVIDCFLCKLVEKLKGSEERDKLIAVLGRQGFAPTEGFEVEIDTLANQQPPIVRLKYHKEDREGNLIFDFNEVIPSQLLKKLVADGKLEEPKDWTKQ